LIRNHSYLLADVRLGFERYERKAERSALGQSLRRALDQQLVQPQEPPQATVGVPFPAQVAVHSSTPQLSVEPVHALLAAPQVSSQVPVPQLITPDPQAPLAMHETSQA
jgi:hypothetical protein